MNLLSHVLLRIITAALLCLLADTAYVLYQTNQQAQASARHNTEALAKQLRVQAMRINSGFAGMAPFPDFELWQQTHDLTGICVRFVNLENHGVHSLCHGSEPSQAVPEWFKTSYRLLFRPDVALTETIGFNSHDYGILTVTPSAELAFAQAWHDVVHLLGLSLATVLAVCGLVYASIRRALRPVQAIVLGLRRLAQGELNYRLPAFALPEWQHIADAINQLAATQQQLLDERQTLAVQLLNLQDEERRYLARELHDELGQCLAAINALTTSMTQTASIQCPGLLAETAQIQRITRHMLDSVRGLLQRLRPAEWDGLGLAASLQSLVDTWQNQAGGKTRYQLHLDGDAALLPDVLAMTVLRIAQECLTNIAKHAAASSVAVRLGINAETVRLTVEDNGVAKQLPFAKSGGIGLLGIRERATALHGTLTLTIAAPHGLQVAVTLPRNTMIAS
jgi:two-component system sensor histidine kinase UhpB